MPIEEIPRHEWGRFCDTFSRQHRRWIIDVAASDHHDLRPAGSGSGLEAEILEYDRVGRTTTDEGAAATATVQLKALIREAVLESIGLARSPAGEEQIVVTAESRTGKRLTHAVQAPTRVRLEHTEHGADQALYIDTKSYTVVIHFPITAPMEMLNGFTE